MATPLTLRHLRANESLRSSFATRGELRNLLSGTDHTCNASKAADRLLDRLIQHFGPNALVEDVSTALQSKPQGAVEAPPSAYQGTRQARPKGTDEAAQAGAKAGDELHGGDGASGETDHPAPSAEKGDNDDERVSASDDLDPAFAESDSVGQDGNPEPPKDRAGGVGCAKKDEDTRSSAREVEHSDVRADSKSEVTGDRTDDPARKTPKTQAARDGATTEDLTGPPGVDCHEPSSNPMREHGDSFGSPGEDAPSLTGPDREEQGDPTADYPERIGRPIQSYGGDTAPAWEALASAARRGRRKVREVERALRRLLDEVDLGGLDESPRLSARKLIVELCSKRCALPRAVRREIALPIVVLACDVSGSCSATCEETLIAALAIAEELPHVLVVRHSNGQVVDAVGPVKPSAECRRESEAPRLDAYVRSLGRPVAGVVAWGDWDAGDAYRAFCEGGAKLFWLDSYAAKHGPRTASKNLRTNAKDWRAQPAGWWQGVNDAASTVNALKGMIRT